MSRPLLHYGSLSPVSITATLCGSPMTPQHATFRSYELVQANHETMPYLFDTDACQDCYEKLLWLGELKPDQVQPLDIRNLDS